MSEHGMFWPLGGFSSMSKTGCCQNNGQSILKTNVSSGNQGKSYQRGEQWVIRGSGNLPLPVLIINIFLPFAIWSGIFNPKHLSLWCFYQMRYVGPVSPANPLFLFILEWNVSVVPWLFCLCFLQFGSSRPCLSHRFSHCSCPQRLCSVWQRPGRFSPFLV